MEENDCPICLTPLLPPERELFTDEPQEAPVELFRHVNVSGGAAHYIHSACQIQYINSKIDARAISCVFCRGMLGTPQQCINEVLRQNRTVWQRMSSIDTNTIISYLPSQNTVVVSGAFLLALGGIMQMGRPNPVGLFIAFIIATGGRRGGTRRKNKKMTRRMRGGDKKGIIDSPESLVSFLDIISKLSEPYYVILTGPNVIDFLKILNINTDNIRIAHLDIDSNKLQDNNITI